MPFPLPQSCRTPLLTLAIVLGFALPPVAQAEPPGETPQAQPLPPGIAPTGKHVPGYVVYGRPAEYTIAPDPWAPGTRRPLFYGAGFAPYVGFYGAPRHRDAKP